MRLSAMVFVLLSMTLPASAQVLEETSGADARLLAERSPRRIGANAAAGRLRPSAPLAQLDRASGYETGHGSAAIPLRIISKKVSSLAATRWGIKGRPHRNTRVEAHAVAAAP